MTDQPSHARSFGRVADAYDRARPTYPAEAAMWLAGHHPVNVLELGAGTGKLTEVLIAAGHTVHATDPDAQMLSRLRQRLPDVPTAVASAEELPAADGSYDVVVAGQAFHWFDHERALPEIARVLRPGGRLALVWNQRDVRIPWVRRLGRIIGDQDQRNDLAAELGEAPRFAEVEEEEFRHWQVVDRDSIQDLTLSRSNVAVLGEDEQRAKLAEVVAFYDDYGRGMDGMQLPYVARCFRASVLPDPPAVPSEKESGAQSGAGDDDAGGPAETRSSDGGDSDLLLIDFR